MSSRTSRGVLAAWVAAAVGGFGAGRLLGPHPLGLPTAPPPERRLEGAPAPTPPRLVGRGPGTRPPGGPSATESTSQIVTTSTEADPTLPALPREVDTRGSGWRTEGYGREAWVAHQHVVAGDAQGADESPFKGAEPRFQDMWMQLARATLEIERRAGGPPPWHATEFEVFGTLGWNPNFLQEGRHFQPDASPEASLAWYESRSGRALPPAEREEFLAILGSYARSRAEMVAGLARTVRSLSRTPPHESPRGALLVRRGKLVWIPIEQSPALQQLLDESEAMQLAFKHKMLDVLEVPR